MLPDPVIEMHEGFMVVRDDILPGGTKRRAIHALFDDRPEYVYASPVYGYAQVALAHAARDHGREATIFCAKRKEHAPLTKQAIAAGATVIEVPHGYLSVVTARAREYCKTVNAKLLPFGLDDPLFIEALAAVVRQMDVAPFEVWTACGSGALTRALQLAWPAARFVGVKVGSAPNAGRAEVIAAPERYEQPAYFLPPFPSCPNYDAKVWRFMKANARPGALFWNVAS